MSVPTTLQGTHDGCGGTVVFRPAAFRRELLAGATVELQAACQACGATLSTPWSLPEALARDAWQVDDAELVAAAEMPVELPLAAGAEQWQPMSMQRPMQPSGAASLQPAPEPEAFTAAAPSHTHNHAPLGGFHVERASSFRVHDDEADQPARRAADAQSRAELDGFLTEFSSRVDLARQNLQRITTELPSILDASEDEGGFRAPRLVRGSVPPAPALAPQQPAPVAPVEPAPDVASAPEPVAPSAIVSAPSLTPEIGTDSRPAQLPEPHDMSVLSPVEPVLPAPYVAAAEPEPEPEPEPEAAAPQTAPMIVAAERQIAPTDDDVFPPVADAVVPAAPAAAVAAGFAFPNAMQASVASPELTPALLQTPAPAVDASVAFEPNSGFDWGPEAHDDVAIAAKLGRRRAQRDAGTDAAAKQRFSLRRSGPGVDDANDGVDAPRPIGPEAAYDDLVGGDGETHSTRRSSIGLAEVLLIVVLAAVSGVAAVKLITSPTTPASSATDSIPSATTPSSTPAGVAPPAATPPATKPTTSAGRATRTSATARARTRSTAPTTGRAIATGGAATTTAASDNPLANAAAGATAQPSAQSTDTPSTPAP